MSRKHELQDIIRGNGPVVQGANIQAAIAFLGRKTETDSGSESEKYLSLQEVVALTNGIDQRLRKKALPQKSTPRIKKGCIFE
jgi:hypothetical protein